MQNYKLFVLDDSQRVVDSMRFTTPSDEDACAWAKHLAGERRFELWHDKRRVHCSHEGPSVIDALLALFPDQAIRPIYLVSHAART